MKYFIYDMYKVYKLNVGLIDKKLILDFMWVCKYGKL